jgi:sulfite reductase (ferredoxin)
MSQTAVLHWAFQISPRLEVELEEFKDSVELFKFGEISEDEFRAIRVPMGVYEQRESGAYVLRVRLPAGCLLPEQLGCLARVATSFGNGTLHFSTRHDVQVHGVRLSAIHEALVMLAKAGLACKGSGGNTVRNVTVCHNAGVCADELFDVAPYSVALTERLLADATSFQLPRKYKIAFSGCPADCAGISVSDLGFVARVRGGQEGFAVYVGGGMGKQSRIGELLDEFIPAADVYVVTEAVKRVFGKYGDRANNARIRALAIS